MPSPGVGGLDAGLIHLLVSWVVGDSERIATECEVVDGLRPRYQGQGIVGGVDDVDDVVRRVVGDALRTETDHRCSTDARACTSGDHENFAGGVGT